MKGNEECMTRRNMGLQTEQRPWKYTRGVPATMPVPQTSRRRGLLTRTLLTLPILLLATLPAAVASNFDAGADDDRQVKLASLAAQLNQSCSTLSASTYDEVVTTLKHGLLYSSQDPISILIPNCAPATILHSLAKRYADTFSVPIQAITPTQLPATANGAYAFYYDGLADPGGPAYDGRVWTAIEGPLVSVEKLAWQARPVAAYVAGDNASAAALETATVLPDRFRPEGLFRTWITTFYNMGMMARNKLRVPVTWDDMLALAQQVHNTDLDGDGKPESALCLDLAPGCTGGAVLSAIYASMAQTTGRQQGIWFNRTTFQPLFPNPAMAQALRILRALSQFGSNTDNSSACGLLNAQYMAGKCLMTLGTYSALLYFDKSQPGMGVVGNITVARAPGSTWVWAGQRADTTFNASVPYSGLSRCSQTTAPIPADASSAQAIDPICPLSRKFVYQGADGRNVTTFVNIASFSSRIPISTSGSQSTSALQQGTTQVFLSWLTSAYELQQSNIFLLIFNTSMTPQDWERTRYNSGDVFQYFSLYVRELNVYNETHAEDIGLPFGGLYRVVLDNMAQQALSASDNDIAGIMQQGLHNFSFVQNLYPYNHTLLLFLNATLGVTYTPDDGSNKTAAMQNMSGKLGVVLAAVLTPTLALTVVALLVWWHVTTIKRSHRTLLGKAIPPRTGSSTTLVVTDIQSSTVLWEALPTEAMDAAIRMHHRCIRSLLATHNGYESATEGDSFICAFHTASSALAFAINAQLALLQQDWPAELLQHPESEEVRVSTAKLAAGAHSNDKDVGGPGLGHVACAESVWKPSTAGGLGSTSTPPDSPRGRIFRPSLIASFSGMTRLNTGGNVASSLGSRAGSAGLISTPSNAAARVQAGLQNFGTFHSGPQSAPVSPVDSYLKRDPDAPHAEGLGTATSFRFAASGSDQSVISKIKHWRSRSCRRESVDVARTSTLQASFTGGTAASKVSIMLEGHDTSGPVTSPAASRLQQQPHLATAAAAGGGGTGCRTEAGCDSPDTVIPHAATLAARCKLQPLDLAMVEVDTAIAHDAVNLTPRQLLQMPIFQNAMTSAFCQVMMKDTKWSGDAAEAAALQRTPSATHLKENDYHLDSEADLHLSEMETEANVSLGLGWSWLQLLKIMYPRAEGTGNADVHGLHSPISKAYSRHFSTASLAGSPEATTLIFRGLRVRVGIHSGVKLTEELVIDKATQRQQYTGAPMAAAKAITDAAQGGMVLMTAAAYARSSHEKAAAAGQPKPASPYSTDAPIILYAGLHDLGLAAAAAEACVSGGRSSATRDVATVQLAQAEAGGNKSGRSKLALLALVFKGKPPASSSGAVGRCASCGASVSHSVPEPCVSPFRSSLHSTHPLQLMRPLSQQQQQQLPTAGSSMRQAHERSVGPRQASFRLPTPLRNPSSRALPRLPASESTYQDGSTAGMLPVQRQASSLLRQCSSALQVTTMAAAVAVQPAAATPTSDVYMAMPAQLQARLAHLGPVRSKKMELPGTLSAPMPAAAIAFMHAFGISTLLADIPGPARAALSIFSNCVLQQLSLAGGYLVETADGFVLAAFTNPGPAVAWALACIEELHHQAWPTAILEHEQGMEVLHVPARAAEGSVPLFSGCSSRRASYCVYSPDTAPASPGAADIDGSLVPRQRNESDTGSPSFCRSPAAVVCTPATAPRHPAEPRRSSRPSTLVPPAGRRLMDGEVTGRLSTSSVARINGPPPVVIARGLRCRTGIDVGTIKPELHPMTGRMQYRGRVMNRAARIAAKASPGQVLTSAAAFVLAQDHEAVSEGGITGHDLGAFDLKGVAEPMELVSCTRMQAGVPAVHLP